MNAFFSYTKAHSKRGSSTIQGPFHDEKAQDTGTHIHMHAHASTPTTFRVTYLSCMSSK
jgi:hypothetical protein